MIRPSRSWTLVGSSLDELWPDPDRREAALERILLRINGVAHRNGYAHRPLPNVRTVPVSREQFRAMGKPVPRGLTR